MGQKKILVVEGLPGVGQILENTLEILKNNDRINGIEYLSLGSYNLTAKLSANAKKLKLGSLGRALNFLAARLMLGKIAFQKLCTIGKPVIMLRYFHSVKIMDAVFQNGDYERVFQKIEEEKPIPEDLITYIFVDIPFEKASERFSLSLEDFRKVRRQYKKAAKDQKWVIINARRNNRALIRFLRAYLKK